MSQVNNLSNTSSNPAIPTSFATDSGTAVPANNQLVIVGGTGLSTTGSGNTVTIDFDGTAGVTSITATAPLTASAPSGAVTLSLTTPLDETYGGTGQTTYTLGDTLYSSATNTLAKLPGNTDTAIKILTQTGDGVNSSAPQWLPYPTASSSIFMFTKDSSDISTYYQAVLLTLYSASTLTSVTRSVTTSPTLLETFATNANFPNINNIAPGLFTVHYDIQKASGGNNYYSYAVIYKRTTGGVETLLATTENSSTTSSNDKLSISVVAFVNAPTVLNLTDRIVVKIYAVMISSTVNITLYWDDATGSRFELPTSNTSTTLQGTAPLTVNGVSGSPQSGTLTVALTTPLASQYGGTGYNNGTNIINLSGGASGKYLASDPAGNGTWATIPGGDITGSALTASNDTNVTLTLGGSASTALLRASSITAGWTGTLSPARGGTGTNNGTSTITLGGSLTTSGAFTSIFTMTANTSVTFPISGTLATTGATIPSITGTANEVLVNGTVGSPVTGTAVTLTLPQDIDTAATVRFGKLGLGVAASNNQLSINGNASIGYSDTSAPTNGLIVAGRTAIGASSPYSNTLLSVATPANTLYGIQIGGTLSSLSLEMAPRATQTLYSSLYTTSAITPNALTNPLVASHYATPTFTLSSSLSGSLYGFYHNPTVATTASNFTLANAFGIYADAGALTGGGSVTNAYGGYFVNPTFGSTVKCALYAANAAVGYNVTPPSSGMIISGNVGIGTTSPSGLFTTASTSTPVRANLIFNENNNTAAATGKGATIYFRTRDSINAVQAQFYIAASTETTDCSSSSMIVGTSLVGLPRDVFRIAANGGISVGTSYISTTPPTNGAIIEGNVGIGTNAPSFPLQISSSSTTSGLYNNPSLSTNTSSVNNVGLYNIPSISTTAANSTSYGFLNNPTFTASGSGTYTNSFGSYFTGTLLGTNTYTSYFVAPGGGTNRAAIYTDNISVGYTGVTPPSNGALIKGAVGINNNNPGSTLVVSGTGTNGGVGTATILVGESNVRSWYLSAGWTTSGHFSIVNGSNSTNVISLEGNNNNNNIGFNGTSFGNGTQVIFIANRTANPSANPTGGGILYVEAGALKYRGSGGNTTTIAIA